MLTSGHYQHIAGLHIFNLRAGRQTVLREADAAVTATAVTSPQNQTAYAYGGGTYNYPTGPGPLLDMFNGYLYLFSTNDKAGHTSVTQIPPALQSGTASAASLGATTTNTYPYLFYGAFDGRTEILVWQ